MSSDTSSWGHWGNKLAAVSRPKQSSQNRIIGVDLVGYGPIGRALSVKLASSSKYNVVSVADSSAVLYPKTNSQVLEIAKWKAQKRGNKLSDFQGAKVGAKGDLLQGIQFSNSSIVVDCTNSDYSKHEEAKKRAVFAFDSNKHYVTANKVALAFHYGEVFDLAKKKNLRVGYGATNLSARHAISVAQSMEKDELTRVGALLNSATTVVLSSLEEDRNLSMDKAIEIARKDGILESDPLIDLDGWDAAAKTAILSNAVYPERRITINDVSRSGIRDEKAMSLIQTARRDRSKKTKVREVSEITRDKAIVEPRLVDSNSSLAVGGHSGIVTLLSRVTGEIAIRSHFPASGIELTSSVLLSDVNQIAFVIG